jgi:hypothetical protein
MIYIYKSTYDKAMMIECCHTLLAGITMVRSQWYVHFTVLTIPFIIMNITTNTIISPFPFFSAPDGPISPPTRLVALYFFFCRCEYILYVYTYIYIYLYLYICVNMYIYMCIHISIYLYIYMYILVGVDCMQSTCLFNIFTYIYIYIYIYTYICMYIYVYTYIYISIYICIYL